MNIYKKQICINCANGSCTNRIKEMKIDNVIIIKCDDFVCKYRRNNFARRKQCQKYYQLY